MWRSVTFFQFILVLLCCTSTKSTMPWLLRIYSNIIQHFGCICISATQSNKKSTLEWGRCLWSSAIWSKLVCISSYKTLFWYTLFDLHGEILVDSYGITVATFKLSRVWGLMSCPGSLWHEAWGNQESNYWPCSSSITA